MSLPEPYYQDEYVTLYWGDCRTILPELSAVDHVITDPPYEAEAHTQQRRTKPTFAPRGGGIDRREAAIRAVDFLPITDELRRQTACHLGRLAQRWVLVFCQAETVGDWRQVLVSAGLTWRRSCVWVKPDGQPQLSGDRPGMGYESIACAHAKGASHWNSGGRLGVWTCATASDPNAERTGHLTQKPIRLMKELVTSFTDPGETILDPFAGSGTTLVAAKTLGRKAIGIELEPKWCEVTAKRLRNTEYKPPLFTMGRDSGKQGALV